jgi:hypothetical protein
MKVLTGTLLTLAAGAGGLLTLPALGRATPAVHLMTSIQALSHGHDEVRYAVTVRPAGGPAHVVTAVLGTRRPAAWTAVAAGCLSSPDRTTVACDLGDVSEAQSRTLRLTARPGDLAQVPVVVQVRAANAPPVTSSLGTTRPIGLRRSGEAPGVRGVWEPPALPSADEPPAPESAPSPESPEPSESPLPSPSPEPSRSPESSGTAEPSESPALPVPSEPSESPAGASPAVVAPSGESAEPAASEAASPADSTQSPPAASPAAVRPPDRHAPPQHVPPRPVPHRGPVASPSGSASPARSGPVIPHAPAIPHIPGSPGAGAADPGAQGAGNPPPAVSVPPPGGLMGGLGGAPGKPPTSSPSATLPEVAPRSSPGPGISELNTLSPASAMRAGRESWATLIAVAVVAEAGLLWVVTGFTVLRRKRPPRRRARRPILSRLHQ